MSGLTELEAADAYCRYLANRHYENFSIASLVLPPDLRVHLARIYGFCRTTDDFGDESGDAALGRLEAWREQVEQCFGGEAEPIHPVLHALKRTTASCRIPPQPFLNLIEANIQDQRVNAYETWEELRAYCAFSAAPVGRMVLRVFAVDDPRAEALSDDVCIGLQLANFAQDVRVDREKGRCYLIGSEVRVSGLHEAVRLLCDRAAALLASGQELEGMVPLRLRIQLALYRLGGLAIIAAVRDLHYRTDEARPRVSSLVKARLVPTAVIQSRRNGYAPARQIA